jgi:hypothetical protein
MNLNDKVELVLFLCHLMTLTDSYIQVGQTIDWVDQFIKDEECKKVNDSLSRTIPALRDRTSDDEIQEVDP